MFGNISVIEIPKEEQANYNNYSQRLDVDNVKYLINMISLV